MEFLKKKFEKKDHNNYFKKKEYKNLEKEDFEIKDIAIKKDLIFELPIEETKKLKNKNNIDNNIFK